MINLLLVILGSAIIAAILALAIKGVACLLTCPVPKDENNCVECGGGPCRVWSGVKGGVSGSSAPVTQGELLRHVTKPSPNCTAEPDTDYED